MAACTKCGRWAGIGRSAHPYDCVADQAQQATLRKPMDPAVKTGATAGIAMALTLVAVGAIAAIVYSLLK